MSALRQTERDLDLRPPRPAADYDIRIDGAISEANAITLDAWGMKNTQGGLRFPGFPPVAYVIMEVSRGCLPYAPASLLPRMGCPEAGIVGQGSLLKLPRTPIWPRCCIAVPHRMTQPAGSRCWRMSYSSVSGASLATG